MTLNFLSSLALPPKCWDYSLVPPCPVSCSVGDSIVNAKRALYRLNYIPSPNPLVFKMRTTEPGMAAHTWNPRAQKAEAIEAPQVQGQPGLYREF